jgi:hypothetical protein
MDSPNALLTFQTYSPRVMQATLDLDALYPDGYQQAAFLHRFADFSRSHPAHSSLFEQAGHLLTYRSEQIVPERSDSRPPLLLVFGNPASHSVEAGMFFASEGNGREHRLWQGLSNAGILSFHRGEKSASDQDLDGNELRQDSLFSLDYDSPCRLGLAVYFSFPTPASHPKWAGVTGLRRLFGKQALDRIIEYERKRLNQVIHDFIGEAGAIIVFQKDAYIGLASTDSPTYTLPDAQAGLLIGSYRLAPHVRLYGCPPTRLIHSQQTQTVLRMLQERISLR